MPSLRNRLTEAEVRSVKESGWYSDGAGLYLQVTSPTAKSWVFRYTKNKKERRVGLGSYPTIGLKDARDTADECRKLKAHGDDPRDFLAKRRFKETADRLEWTFGECAEAYMEIHRPSWSNPKHAQQWKNTLANYAYPHIGKLSIDSIDTNDVVACLQPIWNEKTETANRVRQRIQKVCDWARAKGYRSSENPAVWKGLIENILPSPKRVKAPKHHPYMEESQLPGFYEWLKRKNSVSAECLRFVILTGARHGEGRGALYSEIDEEKSVWTLPPSRMKARKEHSVPLSLEAIRIVEDMRSNETGNYVFSTNGAKGISEAALRKLLSEYIRKTQTKHCVVHGFRSSFRIWAEANSSLGFAALETAISHRRGNSVESAYLDNDFLEERRALMEDWSQFLLSGGR